jgi:hypothetical protein
MDWKRLEDAFAKKAQSTLDGLMRKHPGHRFYAIALHECYRELDGQITLPLVAANSVQRLPSAKNGEDAAYEYNPADWRWSAVRVTTKELTQLHAALEEEANRSTQYHWLNIEKRFMATMVRATKRLYAAFKEHPQTTSDFIAYFDDEHGDIDLIRACVPKRMFLKHFGDVEASASAERASAALPQSQLLSRYMSDLGEHEDQIAKLGEAAIDPLIAALKDVEHGTTAARLLGRIGVADAKVIRALRREVGKPNYLGNWSARSLGLLSDGEYLLKLADENMTRKNAISGLATPLQGWADSAANHIPLDYRLLERLLDKKCRKCNHLAKEELKPGCTYCHIQSADIDEALRGLTSRHVMIRQHAVCVLGERSLGKAAAKRVLPVLAERLNDPHPNVRRLALLSISDWKGEAKLYRDELKKRLKDSDADVRYTAKYVLA